MKRTALFLLFALMAITIPAYGLEFSADSIALCATDTGVFVTSITNNGNFQDSYTISLSGDASRWAVVAPAGFSLKSGETTDVYVYVTPSLQALAGDYMLKVIAVGASGVQEKELAIKVLDCHSAEFTAEKTEADVCSATQAQYFLQLSNTGKYTENFVLGLTGQAAKWSILSEELVTLTAGASKEIKIYSTPPADQTGDFELTVTAASQNSRATASQKLMLESKQCYDFAATPDVNYLSFCEASEAKIPLAIENAGTVDNSYTLSLIGPAWATIENAKLDVPAGQTKFTNVVLFPGFGIAGNFNIKANIVPAKGTATTQEIVANVKKCFSSDLKLSVAEDIVCPNTEKAYAISLVNTGETDTRFAITISGADFATVDEKFIDISAGESADFNLLVAPVNSGESTIVVKAEAQDDSKVVSSANLELKVESVQNCFGVETTSALSRIAVSAGEPALVPIILENKGLESSIYDLEVSGTGAAFVQLNPASLELASKTSRTVYAYVAVPEDAAKDSYKVTIAARLKDQASTVSTTSFDVVLDGAEEPSSQITGGAPVSERLSTMKASITGFFSGIGEKFAVLGDKIKSLIPARDKTPEAEEETAEEDLAVEEQAEEEAEAPAVEESEEQPAEEPAEEEQAEDEIVEEESEEAEEAEEKTEESESAEEETKTQYLSAALRAKLAKDNEVSKEIAEDSNETTISDRLGNIKSSLITGFAATSGFLSETTYYIPNWAFILLVIWVVGMLSYFLRKKNIVQKFNDFLEEDTKEELKPEETPKKNGNSKNGKKKSAQEILDEELEEEKKTKKTKKKKIEYEEDELVDEEPLNEEDEE